jgi:signal transduction histidine kinase
MVHPGDQSFVRNSFASALRKNSGFNFEYRIITSNEKVKYLHSIGQAFHNTKKTFGRIFGIVMDITDRKIDEENLGKYLFELKKSKNLLEDRAMELASLNEQLTAASNELSKTNDEKDKFFSILAHDLRSPFHGLLGFSNMLIAEYDNLSVEEKKNIAARINHSAQFVFKLIENLLEWSRLQSGRMEIKPVKTDLNETVLYIFNLLNNSAVAKEIKLINEIPENIFVFADANMLNSVLENLISNAIKFSKRNSAVTISSVVLGTHVEVFVKDDGIGIKESDLEKLFKIDSHHSTSGTEEEKGTGLGLILCREMIEKMNGSINVVSKINEGSTFSFTIPIST